MNTRMMLGAMLVVVGTGCTELPFPGQDGGSGTPDANVVQYIEPNLTELQRRVFTPSCASSSCHGSAESKGLSMVAGRTWAEVVNQRARTYPMCTDGGIPDAGDPDAGPFLVRVVPFKPDASFLVDKIESTTAELAPTCGGRQMPRTNQRLPQYAIDAVKTWIAEGAQDN